MLSVFYQSGQVSDWHMGCLRHLRYDAGAIVRIQADGHELEYIREIAGHIIPKCTTRVQSFYGDLAKNIVAAFDDPKGE